VGLSSKPNTSIWYRALFQPSLAAGIVKPENMVGYRQHFLHIRGSRHTPANWESVPDAMGAFFDCLKGEKDPRASGPCSDISCSRSFIRCRTETGDRAASL